MTEKRDCPVCDGQEKECLYRQKFWALSGQRQLTGYDIVVCSDCGFAYADNIPGQDWFDSYYREMSKYTYDQRDGQESPVDMARFRSITEMISKHLPDRGSRIIDFGCATGSLLNHLKKAGYANLLGMDKGSSSAQIAEKLFSISVVNAGLEEIAHSEEPFDLLIQSGTLEHIRDIRTLLEEMMLVLKPNGLMYIEVPDVAGFEDCMHAPFQEFSIEHINFFSRQSLTNLMSRFGFEPVDVLQLKRDYTAITRMSVLCGFFRFTGEKGKELIFDDETAPALRRYVGKSMDEESRVSDIIDGLVATQVPLIVWGVGTYTLHLMQTTEFSRMKIIAFADSNKNYQSQTLLGKPVLAPSELKKYSEPILISSYAFQAEIEEQIRQKLGLTNEVITLRESAQSPGSGSESKICGRDTGNDLTFRQGGSRPAGEERN
jgi:SAM-dependent methyltransferase